MNKLKKYLLAIGWLVIPVAALTLIGGPAVLSGASRFTHRGGTKVITLAEELQLDPGQSIDLDPVHVGQFHFISFLGTHDGEGGEEVKLHFGFLTQEGNLSDPLPRLRLPPCTIVGGSEIGGVLNCGSTLKVDFPEQVYRVGGPFLAVRLTHRNGPIFKVTLKVFLSK
jgi:hypothetical protein